jgi:hypothetical protein
LAIRMSRWAGLLSKGTRGSVRAASLSRLRELIRADA